MRQLARRLDVNVDTVSEWEAGHKVPTRANTYKLLDTFMVEMQEAGAIRSRARRLRQRATGDLDRWAGDEAMAHIAELLPAGLRGQYTDMPVSDADVGTC